MSKNTNEKNFKKIFLQDVSERRGYNNDRTHRNSHQNIALFAKRTQSQIKIDINTQNTLLSWS